MTLRKSTEAEEISPKRDSCPIVEAIKEIGGEWRLIVIRYLNDGPMGFNDLLKNIEGLNSKTLSSTLKYLEAHSIVTREVESTRPFRVRYSLTDKGKSLKYSLEDLKRWGEEWIIEPRSQAGQ
ncbi:MAG: helix-turn-helix transcriptional regulator [Candidatus Thermoplasmatota archaeon]|nr:helix-turn-helix transcriptional regulator [Candidatus Thermoplasmatota archaeon]